jgi:ParB family transcriptional regulator, chromosome partitioning protein
MTTPPRAVAALAERAEAAGGEVLASYREPVGGHWQLFALLPVERLEPTPFQRDRSRPHVERLRGVISRLDRFVDPIVAVEAPGEDGRYWVPNGSHRLAALEKLKARLAPVILLLEREAAYDILALNTEKAHTLKEKSLEVIRMYRGLRDEQPRAKEEDFAFEFEEPHFATLGLLYESKPRFAGGAYAPILRRVDRFLDLSLARGYAERERRAGLVEAADARLDALVAKIKRRGVTHPFLKPYLLARTSPLTRARKRLPTFDQTFERLAEALDAFDPASVRADSIARAAGAGGAT